MGTGPSFERSELEVPSRSEMEEGIRRILGRQASAILVGNLVDYMEATVTEALLVRLPSVRMERLSDEVVEDLRTIRGIAEAADD